MLTRDKFSARPLMGAVRLEVISKPLLGGHTFGDVGLCDKRTVVSCKMMCAEHIQREDLVMQDALVTCDIVEDAIRNSLFGGRNADAAELACRRSRAGRLPAS